MPFRQHATVPPTMIDIQLVRRDPDRVRAALARRGDTSDLDRLVVSDTRWREQTGRRGEGPARGEAPAEGGAGGRRGPGGAPAPGVGGRGRGPGPGGEAHAAA